MSRGLTSPLPRSVRVARIIVRRLRRRAPNPFADWRRRLATLSGAILLGLVALLFASGGDLLQRSFAGVVRRYPYSPLMLTPGLFVSIVWLTRRFAPDARGSGIPQVIAASRSPAAKASQPLVSLRTAMAKLLMTLSMMAGGASVGREGPTVQVSAAIMVETHRRLGVRLTPGVLIAGGAAGVAAAFNTPLAGIAFAIEELAASYEQRVTMFVMGAVMIAGMVSLGLAGDYVYFGRLPDTLGLGDTLLVAPLAGIVGGLAGGLFARLLLAQARGAAPFVALGRRPLLLALGCGLVVASLGIASDGSTWGTGYEPTRALLAGEETSMWFAPAKFVASLATAISGAPGGIFAPSLAVGAGVGQMIAAALPAIPSGPIVLIGMTAYFVGVVRAPFTAVIIVSEATGNHGAILSLFAAALIADAVSAYICPTRLYHGLSEAFLASARRKAG